MSDERLMELKDALYLGLDNYYPNIIGELIEAVTELKDKVEQLKAELEAIKELGDLTEDDIPWLRGEGEYGEN